MSQSSERKSKISTESSQEEHVPLKKQRMDLHFHDDSSVSKYTWPGDDSISSGWEVLDSDVEEEPSETLRSSICGESSSGGITRNLHNTASQNSRNNTDHHPYKHGTVNCMENSNVVNRTCLNNPLNTATIERENHCIHPGEGKPGDGSVFNSDESGDDDDDDEDSYRTFSSSSTITESAEYITLVDKQTQTNGLYPPEVDREAFVMKIMKTFKSNSLYDSFCYSLPRSEDAINSYNNVVSGILNLSDQCRYGLVEATCADFPNEESMHFAEGIVEDMRKRYKKMVGDSDEIENPKTNLIHTLHEVLNGNLEKEVDNDLPHNIVFVVSDGDNDLAADWFGQFQVCINPVTYVLSLRMSDFTPSRHVGIINGLGHKQLTKEICSKIISEMEKFECSRQLRMDVDVQSFESMIFFKTSENEGLLFIKIQSEAKFYQRFVNSSALDRNEWNKRETFLPFNNGCYQDNVLMFGGVVSELSNIAALITVSWPSVQIVTTDITEFMFTGDCDWKSRTPKQSPKKSFTLSVTRRNSILQTLNKNGLLSREKQEELIRNVMVTEVNIKKRLECNCLDNLDFHPCFIDYINYKCLDVSELEHNLSRRINLLDKMGDNVMVNYDPDSQNMSVAQYLVSMSEHDCYYSFCISEMATRDMWHCHICGKCNLENEWHCSKCDKCSRIQSVCEHCGFDGCSFIVKPGSVDQSAALKREWKINLDTTDIPKWSTTVYTTEEDTSFNMENFMRDELGLIDPMAFLLGSEARGGGNRQGRSRQKYEKKIEGNPKMLTEAGCLLQ